MRPSVLITFPIWGNYSIQNHWVLSLTVWSSNETCILLCPKKTKIPGVYPVAVRKTHPFPTLKLSFLSQFSTNIVNLPKAANSDNWLITSLQAIPEPNLNNDWVFVSSKLNLVTKIPEGLGRCDEVKNEEELLKRLEMAADQSSVLVSL